MKPLDYKIKARARAVEELGGQCNYCGSTERLEFDHVDPATKKYRARALWDSRKKYAEEKPKLQLLCHPCHKKKSADEMRKPLVHGTRNAYERKKCRCDLCRAWASANQKAYREKKKNERNANS